MAEASRSWPHHVCMRSRRATSCRTDSCCMKIDVDVKARRSSFNPLARLLEGGRGAPHSNLAFSLDRAICHRVSAAADIHMCAL